MRGWDFIREGAGAAEPRVPGIGAAGEAGPAVPTGHSSSGGGGSAAAAAEPPSSSNSTYSEPTSAFASTGAEVMERGVDVSNDAATATPLDQVRMPAVLTAARNRVAAHKWFNKKITRTHVYSLSIIHLCFMHELLAVYHHLRVS